MKTTALRAIAAACLAGALPTAAHAVTATVRVEGQGSTLLTETPVTLDAAPYTLADAFDQDTVTVPGTSATAQLGRAGGGASLPIGFDIFNFGQGPTSFVTRIGPDAMPASFTPSWRLSVNHVVAQVGADAVTINDGDRALWAFIENFDARELDVAVSSDIVEQGRSFEVTVLSFAPDGTAAPALGASVVYAGVTRTTGTGGRATFTATGTGTQSVTATRSGEVRSPARAVCATAGDPSVCGLSRPTVPPAPTTPATPTTPAPATPVSTPTATAALADNVAPGSRIAFPRPGRLVRTPAAITGTAGPDRSDIQRVQVALARRVGNQCRFMGPRRRLGPVTSCTRRVWLDARSAGGNWSLPLRTVLRPGVWRVWSRAVDGAGNVEATGIARVNTGTFRVVAGAGR